MQDPGRRQRFTQLVLALFLLAPLFAAFRGSGGFQNVFLKTFEDYYDRRGEMARAFLLTFLVGFQCVQIALLIGVPAAWFLSKMHGKLAYAALAVLPLALPTPVAVSGWVQLIAPDAASSFALPIPGFVSELRTELFSWRGAGAVLGFSLWPIVALFAWPAFARARDSSYEAALLLNKPMRAFGAAVLTRCRREIIAGAALVFLIACSDFSVCSLLLVKTLAVEVHDQIALGKHAAAAWTALPLVVLAALFSCFAAPRSKLSAQASNVSQIRTRQLASTIIFFAGLVLGFGLPMLACLRGVLASGKPLSASFHAGAGSLALSARLAAAAALIASAFAVGRMLIWPQTRVASLNAAGIFLLAIPGAFLAAALFALQIKLNHANLMLAWLALGFALRFLYMPLRLVEEGLASIDPALFESAALLGQGRFARAWSVGLPLSAGYLAAAAALVFVLSLGEVALAAVLAPPGAVPATIWLFNQQHMGYDESVFALSLLLGAVAAGTVALGAAAAKWVSK